MGSSLDDDCSVIEHVNGMLDGRFELFEVAWKADAT